MLPIPGIADFLKAAATHYSFVPDRPKSDAEFKQNYAKVAAAAGLTRDQAVRIYAFETGGNGTYDGQAGIVGNRKDARPISPAMGYNQLLSTNTVSLLAEHGDKFVAALSETAERLGGPERKALDHKIATLKKMIAFSRTVPNAWSEHDKLAKTTEGGMGIHAAVLDRDIGPLLQTQKLLDSVMFAKMKGYMRPLTAAELELMNFTGDGNGFDLVTMPQDLRAQVPTSNFFQRSGYERNPIARRTGTVDALFAAIETKMDRASQSQGAKELAEASSPAGHSAPDCLDCGKRRGGFHDIRAHARFAGCCSAGRCLAAAASAQNYPNRPITLVVPFAAGARPTPSRASSPIRCRRSSANRSSSKPSAAPAA